MPFDSTHSAEWEPLLRAAWEARSQAYVPYSHFRVGAAIQLANGDIVTGCNVENASYPVTQCAERSAICTAVTRGLRPGGLVAIAVVTDADALTPPCGACRQVLAEFADSLPVLLANRTSRSRFDLRELLPHAFTGRDLGITAELSDSSMNP